VSERVLEQADEELHRFDAGMRGRVMNAACQRCGSSFVPKRRSARFCSPACRVAAHRARAPVTGAAPHGATARESKSATGTSGASRAFQRSPTAVGDSSVTPSGNLAVEIVHDEHWPSMWRIRFADGSVSGMVNLTRAKDRCKSQRRPT
jgi:hypothetical protein